MAKSKKSKAGIFDILVNGKYVDKVCAVNKAVAVETYQRDHPMETGIVTAKWYDVAPIQMNCDEHVKKLRQIEKAAAQ
ncbi:MAG TPA: hypothetical protein VK709_13405 [Candidatus Saccharimonadales bacterium]|nr:hypothetical protein [Candidatus Saccharimonadales bacterium]